MEHSRWRAVVRNLSIALACLAVGAFPLYSFAGAGSGNAPSPPLASEEPPTAPLLIVEPVPGVILNAQISASLVLAGTDQPFRGDGLPGIRLTVRGGGDLSLWTVEGSANQTKASGTSVCTTDTIRYLRWDWAYQTGAAAEEGIFTTVPSTVPQRLLPDGDQCSQRFGATGEWTISYCIEAKEGGPRGITRDKSGNYRLDDWDKCSSLTVQVPA